MNQEPNLPPMPALSAAVWTSAEREEIKGYLQAYALAAIELNRAALAQEPVGEIARDKVNGWHFAPYLELKKIGIGTKLYAAAPVETKEQIRDAALLEIIMLANKYAADYGRLANGGDNSGHSDAKEDAMLEFAEELRSLQSKPAGGRDE